MIAALILALALQPHERPQGPPSGEPERPREAVGEEVRAELAPTTDPYVAAARAWGDCVRVRAGEAAAGGAADAAAIETGFSACAAEEAALNALWAGEFDAARAGRMMAEYRAIQREAALRYLQHARRDRENPEPERRERRERRPPRR